MSISMVAAHNIHHSSLILAIIALGCMNAVHVVELTLRRDRPRAHRCRRPDCVAAMEQLAKGLW